MTVLTFEQVQVQLGPDESVLDALERAGQQIPNSCRSGICQSCLMQAVEGEVPPASQRRLKQNLAAQGYFLACQCRPQTPMRVAMPGKGLPSFSTKVLSKEAVAEDVMVLRLAVPTGFDCRAGQYVHLDVEQTVRSYSVASVPERDGYIELHVRRVAGGKVSNWVHDELDVEASCTVRGPLGECFYVADAEKEFPILLAGTGTGLAPLEGIVRDALRHGHRGPITLIHGARTRSGLYHAAELHELAAQHPNFQYLPAVKEEGETGDIAQTLKAHFLQHSPAATRVFLCGAPDLVKSMKRQVFMLGAASGHIHTDPFVMAPAPAAA